jgi:nickel transport protein
MQRSGRLLVCIGATLLLLAPARVQAHGVTVEHTVMQTTTVSLVARYDSGEPMAGAQVTIYAPDAPLTPWQTGICDAAGRYQFTPDPTLAGTWEIQVRQAGHGTTIYVETGDMTSSETRATLLPGSSGQPYTPLQLLLMGGAVVWGCIGTGLFFARRRG